MSSQKSVQSIIGKFSDGLKVLDGLISYKPSRAELTLISLTGLKVNTEMKNSAAVTAETNLSGLQKDRKLISFKAKDSASDCIENRIKEISNYVKAEFGKNNPSYLKITSIIAKIAPPSEKKAAPAEGEVAKVVRSKSEKSFQSLVGFGNDICTIISDLGAKYNPSNTNITLVNFKAKVDALAALNEQIVTAETAYSAAVKDRHEAYYGTLGIVNLISAVKDYLAGLEGGKKNSGYIAFTNAVK